jgi:16S rRNA (guanine527-N7)-methyltransferase
MQASRIAELLTPFFGAGGSGEKAASVVPLSSAQLRDISMYVDMLVRWNARMSLTAIREPEDIVTRHFGESFFAARHLFPPPNHEAPPASANPPIDRGGLSVADVGSGAGFPGIPLRLWNPGIHLTLIESNQKKGTFLREVTRTLTLTDVNVFLGRAEDLVRAGSRFDVVTLRAVEHFEKAIQLAASLLAPTGRLAVLVGSTQLDRTRAALPSLTWNAPLPLPSSRSRILLVGVQGTP